jgi:drug/metabolite transporter (DMT)-like permease
MDWFSTTLVCAFSLASADAATKRYFSDCSARAIVMIRFAGIGLLLLPVLWTQAWPTLPLTFWAWLAVLIPIEIFSMLLYMRAISTSALSQTLPYLAFTPVCTTVTGYLLLGESVSPRGLAGIALVTVGAYALNIGRGAVSGRWRLLGPLQAIVRERGSRLMLSVAALYSITSVIGKNLLQYAPPLFFGPFYACILAAIVLIALGVKEPGSFAVIRRRPAAVLLVALTATIEAVTHYFAVQQIEVAYMIAVKRTSLLFGILYGAWLFKEANLVQHLGAGTIMVLGVVLIVY